MRKTLIIPATFKPLEVEYAKMRPELKVSGSAMDIIIADFIESAVLAYEEYTSNILCHSVWDLYLDGLPPKSDPIETPAPLVSAEEVKYWDAGGLETVLAPAKYIVDGSNKLVGRIAPAYGSSWNGAFAGINSCVVRFTAGFANQASVPAVIRDGLMAKIQELYYGIDMSLKYQANWDYYRRIPV